MVESARVGKQVFRKKLVRKHILVPRTMVLHKPIQYLVPRRTRYQVQVRGTPEIPPYKRIGHSTMERR